MRVPKFKWLTPLLLLTGLWGVLVALFAGQDIVTTSREWDIAFAIAARFWLPWLPLLPLTAWLSRAFPLERRRPAPSIVVHLLACAAVVMICQEFTPDRPPGAGREGKPGREEPVEGVIPPPREGGRYRDREGGPPPWVRKERAGLAAPDGMRPMRGGGPWRPFIPRNVIDIIMYGGVVSLTHAVAILRRSRQRERRALELEASLSKARLDALRLQINPHFLFNTLNAIASLIHTRPEAADEMIGSLSELLRASLHGGGGHEVSLADEMEMLRLFTDIERTRFGDRIRFEEDLPVETLTGVVPSLILQPLVENAIRHGLEPRVQAGTVTIRARREENRLLLSVSDDGVGYYPGDDPPERAKSGGIGLANTRARLRALYGDDQKLAIASGASGGTTITLDIPWHTA